MAKTAIIIEGETFVFDKTKYGSVTEVCDHCALKDLCKRIEDAPTLCDYLDIAHYCDYNFRRATADEHQDHAHASAEAEVTGDTTEKATPNNESGPKKKRPKILSMFYALLLCLFYVYLAFGANILLHKLFGWHCSFGSITFGMVFAIIWVLCYIHIKED